MLLIERIEHGATIPVKFQILKKQVAVELVLYVYSHPLPLTRGALAPMGSKCGMG